MRRALIIVASIVFIAGILAFLWFVFGPKEPTLTGTDGVPFGESPDAPLGTDIIGEGNGPVPAGEEVAPRLVRITDRFTSSGVVAINLPTRAVQPESGTGTPETLPGDTEIRYIDRASGNVYSYLVHERTLARVSNRTLPGIQEASWLSDGSMAFVRFLADSTTDAVDTYALRADGTEGFFLEKNLSQVAVSGTTTLFSMLPSGGGITGSVARTDGTNPRTLFTAPFTSLVVHLSNGPYMAHTRASSALDGYALTLDAAGTWSRMFGPFRGLSILPSPSGAWVLESHVEGRVVRLRLYERATGSFISLPVITFTEKCAWSADSTTLFCGVPKALSGNLPDDWYQGATRTFDRLWRIDVADRVATLLIDPSEAEEIDVDVASPTLDSRGDVFTFRDRVTGSLFVYDL